MVASKINVKDNVNDGEIDLSMLDLQDVPVKEIAAVKKAHGLDLSNNHLVTLPKNFPTLVNLIKIDLSRNELKELPENFGELVKLKHLDLYKNQLQHLPLSFSKLTALKWLDLKDNPLVPSIAEVAGHCLDAKQCQKCAKDIVALYSKLQVKVDEERKSREEQRQRSLDEHAAKLKQEKKQKKTKSAKKTDKVSDHGNVSNIAVCNASVKKVGSNKRTNAQSKAISFSFIRFLFKFVTVLAFVFAMCLIGLAVTKVKYGSVAEESVQKFISKSQVPPQLKEVLVIVTEHVFTAQDILVNKTSELLRSDNVNIVWTAFTGVYQNVTQAGSEFYLKIFGK